MCRTAKGLTRPLASHSAPLSLGPAFRSALIATALLSCVVLGLWQFPRFWYNRSDARLGHFWLTERTNLVAWQYQAIPVSKVAETALVADRLVNGEFSTQAGTVIRTFLAKRYAESSNEIGLFAHTPDRCWTESGWRLEPAQPDLKILDVHGITVPFERRIFASTGVGRELVYFAGLVGGQPLPYRLDHNLAVGMKNALQTAADPTGTTLRASDKLFWSRVWDSFRARRPLNGPTQFIRISTPITADGVDQADALLQRFLPDWLSTQPYNDEIQQWRHAQSARPAVEHGRSH